MKPEKELEILNARLAAMYEISVSTMLKYCAEYQNSGDAECYSIAKLAETRAKCIYEMTTGRSFAI